jgi:hypothetical protein
VTLMIDAPALSLVERRLRLGLGGSGPLVPAYHGPRLPAIERAAGSAQPLR